VAREVSVDLSELNALCDRGATLANLRSPLAKLLEAKKQDTQQSFFTESAPNGTPWKPLASSTLAQKQGTSIGRETNRLFNAIDIFLSNNEGQVFNDTPYAGFFQAKRPFLEWTPEDEQRVQQIFDNDVDRRLNR
jgi:phage gpG-like protein